MFIAHSPPRDEAPPIRRGWLSKLYWGSVIVIYAVLVTIAIRSSRVPEPVLRKYVAENYPNELASSPRDRGEVQTLPYKLTTEIRAWRGAGIVPNSEPVDSVADPQQSDAHWRFSSRPIIWMLVLLSIVYLVVTSIAFYTIKVLGASFGEGNFTGIPDATSDIDIGDLELSWTILRNDIINAQTFSRGLDRRSVVFLILGFVTAMLGVVVLLVFVPHDARTGETTPQVVLRLTRTIGLVAFIEGIAWYLLKQHRVLISDQKSMYRMYMRRANYLAALALLAPDPLDAELRKLIVNAVLADPVTDRMAAGETTEALEVWKSKSEGRAAELAEGLAKTARGG